MFYVNLYHSLGKFIRWQIHHFFLFPENRILHFMQIISIPRKQDLTSHILIVSIADNVHEISSPLFWEK